jgi:hypothetical protein
MHDKHYSRSDNDPKVGSIEGEGWDNLGVFNFKAAAKNRGDSNLGILGNVVTKDNLPLSRFLFTACTYFFACF